MAMPGGMISRSTNADVNVGLAMAVTDAVVAATSTWPAKMDDRLSRLMDATHAAMTAHLAATARHMATATTLAVQSVQTMVVEIGRQEATKVRVVQLKRLGVHAMIAHLVGTAHWPNIVGGILWGAGVTLLGYLLGQIEFIRDNVDYIFILIVLVSVLPIVFEIGKRILASRRGETANTSTTDNSTVTVPEDPTP